jgi:hypothetical protein
MIKRERFVIAGLLIVPLGISIAALESLKNTASVECHSLNDAPFSTRLHCAQTTANRRTPEDLAEAIRLIADHSSDPPEAEVQRQAKQLAQQWSQELINQAEAVFQAGDLDKAIKMIEKLPLRSSEYAQVEPRIKAWKATWAKAEDLEKSIKEKLDQRKWAEALELTRQLRGIENEHWANERHAALAQQIQSDRELNDWKLRSPTQPERIAKQELAPIKIAPVRHSARSATPARTEKIEQPEQPDSFVPVPVSQPDPRPSEAPLPPAPVPQPVIEPEPLALPVLEPANPVIPAASPAVPQG